MTNLSTLLEYLDENMDEAAKSVREAISEKLAAYVSKNFIILYNPKTALNNINDNIHLDYSLEDIISFENAMIGYINIEQNNSCGTNTYEVKNSVALSSYGPLLYDLMLSHIYPNYLTPDRNSVSSQALKVWNYYLNNRPDVNKILISSIFDPDNRDHCTLPEEVWKKYHGIGKITSNIQNIYDDLQLAINKENHQSYINQLQSQYNQAIQKAHTYFSKIPAAHKFQIKSPKGLTTLKNNHSRFLQKIPSLIPKQKLPRNFNNKKINSLAQQNLHIEAEAFFGHMYY